MMSGSYPDRALHGPDGRIIYSDGTTGADQEEDMARGIWSGAFWKATAERVVSTAAQAALLALGADAINALDVGWVDVGGFAAGGAVLALLKSLAANVATGNGPSFTDSEQVIPEGTVVLNE